MPVFIGTNTGKNTTSKGIYSADFDLQTGKLSQPKLAAEYSSPGFLALHPTKPILYACGRPDQPTASGTGTVAAFAIGADYSLTFLGDATSGGKDTCHLAVDATGQTVALASYGDGKISTVRLDEKGLPKEIVSLISNHGAGPNPTRQSGPHAHGVYFDHSNTRLFVPDLGLDKVHVYPFDAATSKLGDALPALTTDPGAGPRHVAFSPDQKHAYIINELNGTILTAILNHLKPQGTVKTLPDEFTGNNTCAEVEVSADGRFVYASNRGHDSIAVFSRDAESGALRCLQYAACGGKTPRHFEIAPGGKWLLCGHMDSHTISVLPRDPESGKLGAACCTVNAPSPICILFAR